MKAVVVVPARLASTRLSGKVLADICGKPMLWYVYHQASKARCIEKVYVATDSLEIGRVVSEWGGEYFLTDQDIPSGTARIASVVDQIAADIIVNVQGDEPLIAPQVIDQVVEAFDRAGVDIATPVYRPDSVEALLSPDTIKVVRDARGFALYFSRSPIPFVRDVPPQEWLATTAFWGHIGLYGYRRNVLLNYNRLPISMLERAEKLEQLRFLEAGMSILTVETTYRTVAVDTPHDLERVRGIIAQAKGISSQSAGQSGSKE